MIPLNKIFQVGIYILFGIGLWFIYQGTFNLFDTIGWSSAKLISTGVAIVFGIIFIAKFRGILIKF